MLGFLHVWMLNFKINYFLEESDDILWVHLRKKNFVGKTSDTSHRRRHIAKGKTLTKS